MTTLGLTGNMGSGKSTVARIFSILGVPVFSADNEAREITKESEIVRQIGKKFGNGVIDLTGSLNRKALAAIVFNDKSALAELNELIHPLVWKRYQDWLGKHSGASYIIHEAAILFEAGLAGKFDKVIFIDAPRNVLIDRAMMRDKLTKEQVEERLDSQWPPEKLKELADYVIVNDNYRAVLPRVLEIDEIIKAL